MALVGPSGCGKSSTVALIQRWYDITGGELLLDGRHIDSLSVPWLRSQIGLVGQEPALFNMSIKDNILMGLPYGIDRETVPDAKIRDACLQANCHEFIMELPQGYDTNIGEHGGRLSGGQKQRIAIARALIKNPTVLLLDEATSALDTKSERLVMASLRDSTFGKRTIVIVAHRLSTVRHADSIVFFQDGKIAEQGSDEELLKKRGLYWRAVQAQKLQAVTPGHSEDNVITMDKEVFQNETAKELANTTITMHLQQNDEDLTAQVQKPLVTAFKTFAVDHREIILGLAFALVTGAVSIL